MYKECGGPGKHCHWSAEGGESSSFFFVFLIFFILGCFPQENPQKKNICHVDFLGWKYFGNVYAWELDAPFSFCTSFAQLRLPSLYADDGYILKKKKKGGGDADFWFSSAG